jgi:Ca2+-binding EF-hand superfamily protein
MKKILFFVVLFVAAMLTFSINAFAEKRNKFQHADKNKDGTIDKKEWKMEEKWEHHQEVHSWWKKYADTDGDGNVSEGERAAWKEKEKERIDLDGDGVISPKERRLSWRHAKSKVNKPIEEQYDANKDGWLQEEEAKEMLKAKHAMIETKGEAKVDTEIEEEYDTDGNGVIDKKEAKTLKEDLD